jgi:hypothetical protein
MGMAADRRLNGGYSFGAEALAGPSAAAALRRVRSLADQAPSGRMFQAIATLSELSRQAEAGLRTGNQSQAVTAMENMIAAAPDEPAHQVTPIRKYR